MLGSGKPFGLRFSRSGPSRIEDEGHHVRTFDYSDNADLRHVPVFSRMDLAAIQIEGGVPKKANT
jgi:hypothetical protein